MTRNLQRQLYRVISLIVHRELDRATSPRASTVGNAPPLKPVERVEPTPPAGRGEAGRGDAGRGETTPQSGENTPPAGRGDAGRGETPMKSIDAMQNKKRPLFKQSKRLKMPLLPTPK